MEWVTQNSAECWNYLFFTWATIAIIQNTLASTWQYHATILKHFAGVFWHKHFLHKMVICFALPFLNWFKVTTLLMIIIVYREACELSTKGCYKPKLSMLLLFCRTELSEEKLSPTWSVTPSNLLTCHFYLISSEFYPLMFALKVISDLLLDHMFYKLVKVRNIKLEHQHYSQSTDRFMSGAMACAVYGVGQFSLTQVLWEGALSSLKTSIRLSTQGPAIDSPVVFISEWAIKGKAITGAGVVERRCA